MQITLTRALKELKILDAQIQRQCLELKAVDITQRKFEGKALSSNKLIKDFNLEAHSHYQSIQDLIIRRKAIKAAVVNANATTKVLVGANEMTIAEAIEQKDFVKYKRALLQNLKGQKVKFDREIETARAQMESQLQQVVLQNFGKDRKTSPEDYDAIAKPLIAANELVLVDPLKISDKIAALEKEITDFEGEVDISLSEINSRTEITVN